MRDVRVASLPRTAAWRRVVERLESSAAPRELVTATLDAAPLSTLARDAIVHDAVATLVRLLREGRAPRVDGRMSLVATVADGLDARAAALGRTDAGELAQLATIEALVRALPDRAAFAAIEDEPRFVAIVGELFSRLVERWALSWLERELPSHVGEGARFATLDEVARFREAVVAEIRASSTAVRPLAEGLFRAGSISDDDVRAFVAEALAAMGRALSRAS